LGEGARPAVGDIASLPQHRTAPAAEMTSSFIIEYEDTFNVYEK